MADGAQMALDDYIKIKRKQGTFKPPRKGVKTAVGAGTATARNKRNMKGKGVKRAGQFQGRNQNQNQNLNRGGKRRGGGIQRSGGRRNNVSGQRQGQALVVIGNRGPRQNFLKRQRQRNRGNRAVMGVNVSSGYQQIQLPRNRNNNLSLRNGRGGISQHLVRRARQTFVATSTGNNQRRNNRMAVVRFAQKRVQRARLQLANKRNMNFRPGRVLRDPGIRSALPLMSISSGIRRTRNGFVTVSSREEKQVQRLVVKEKIQRARQIRTNRNNLSPSSSGASNFPRPGPSSGSPRGRGRQPQPQQRRQSPEYFRSQSQRGRRSTPRRSPVKATLNQYERSIPTQGRSMYADREEEVIVPQWNVRRAPSPPLSYSRTTVNNMYDPSNPGLLAEGRQILDPEIQRKINFIQSHRNRSNDDPQARIIPDFRAPTVSSGMKLSDRFKMYMN